MNSIEVVSVHYKTPELIYRQYESVRKFYPEIPYRIIDGSDDGVVYFKDLEDKDKNFKVKRFGYNIHHGPGMDYAIRNSEYDFLLILDSDVSLKKPPIETMFEKFRGYSVGRKRVVNAWGRQSWEDGRIGKLFPKMYKYTYIHPVCMLINKKAYLQFKPFIKHGSPCIDAMIDIHKQGKTQLLAHIEVQDFADIEWTGTVKRWGMNVSKISYLIPRF